MDNALAARYGNVRQCTYEREVEIWVYIAPQVGEEWSPKLSSPKRDVLRLGARQ
jgi:hypothetical protein